MVGIDVEAAAAAVFTMTLFVSFECSIDSMSLAKTTLRAIE